MYINDFCQARVDSQSLLRCRGFCFYDTKIFQVILSFRPCDVIIDYRSDIFITVTTGNASFMSNFCKGFSWLPGQLMLFTAVGKSIQL